MLAVSVVRCTHPAILSPFFHEIDSGLVKDVKIITPSQVRTELQDKLNQAKKDMTLIQQRKTEIA